MKSTSRFRNIGIAMPSCGKFKKRENSTFRFLKRLPVPTYTEDNNAMVDWEDIWCVDGER